jgi:hypothetical protein
MQASYAIQYGAAPATAASLSSSLFDLLFKLMTSAVIVNFGHLAVRRLTASMDTEDTVQEKEEQEQATVDNPVVVARQTEAHQGGEGNAATEATGEALVVAAGAGKATV